MNEDIVIFLERLEQAKEALNDLIATGSLLDNLTKVDVINFEESGVKINRKEDKELFTLITSTVVEKYQKNFEASRTKVTEILDGKYKEEFQKIV
jgi:hypothetical protein